MDCQTQQGYSHTAEAVCVHHTHDCIRYHWCSSPLQDCLSSPRKTMHEIPHETGTCFLGLARCYI